jgi:GntR family transcriptional regulator / MocR family aminotransferase
MRSTTTPGCARSVWARRVDGLIVEDDYDSEFSYDRPAPATMQGTAPERVALLGSMSKTLSPAVNVGWVVAPPRWVEAIRMSHEIPLIPPALNQLALAHFMQSGAYDRYLRTSRLRFLARRAALVAALERRLPEFRIRGAETGLQLMLDLPSGTDAAAIIAAANRRDMLLCELDGLRFAPVPGSPSALLLGYGNLNDAVIDEAVDVLAVVIRESPQTRL